MNFEAWLSEFETGKRQFIGVPVRDLPMRCEIKNREELKRILDYKKRPNDLDNRK